MQDVYKNKGDPKETDNSRGILLADHSGKALVATVKEAIDEKYNPAMPSSQHGAVPQRGTDFATHIIRSVLAVAAMKKYSVLVLFVDLVKAYDKVIRELVYGWGPNPPADKVAFLEGLGVKRSTAQWMAEYIEKNGCLMKQWDVDERAAEMAQSLHANAWFGVSDLETSVRSTTGGRQGCKLGAATFNSVYSIALDVLAAEFDKANITLRLQVPASPFWQGPESSEYETNPESIVDAAFIDDECMVIMAKTPQLLDAAADILLEKTFDIFELLHLTINTAPKKTEALLKNRGVGARESWERRRCEDGELRLQVPGRDVRIDVVQCYKHLGTMCSVTGECFENVLERCSSAMSAYGPMSSKVFGSHLISISHRTYFADSLVFTRLLFAVHVTVPTAKDLKKYNAVYMRVLRKIADESRYSTDVELTDRQVREKLQQMSIDCVLIRKRLLYLGRICRNRPRALLALLHVRVGAKRVPWIELVMRDAQVLRDECMPQDFPSMQDAPDLWHDIMLDRDKWKALVDRVWFTVSCCDRSPCTDKAPALTAFKCSQCAIAFASSRALASHMRAKHNQRTEMRYYVSSGFCPCYHKDFHERLRALAHVSDSRRPKCRNWILQNIDKLPENLVRELDAADAMLRLAAQLKGRSHHLATKPAVSREGKLLS